MLWGAYLGVFHAGIEWGCGPGPQECSGAPRLDRAADLMKRLQNINIMRCDEAAWRFLGLSLAGYNALISLALAAIAVWGAASAARAALIRSSALRDPRFQIGLSRSSA